MKNCRKQISRLLIATLTSACAFTAQAEIVGGTPTPSTNLPNTEHSLLCTLGYLSIGDKLNAFKTPRVCTVGVTFNSPQSGDISETRFGNCIVPAGATSCRDSIESPGAGWSAVKAWPAHSLLSEKEIMTGCIPLQNSYPRADIRTEPPGSSMVTVTHQYNCPTPNNPWYNKTVPYDVNSDGRIAPVDVLIIGNLLRGLERRSIDLLSYSGTIVGRPDVNNDFVVDQRDYEAVLRYLNQNSR